MLTQREPLIATTLNSDQGCRIMSAVNQGVFDPFGNQNQNHTRIARFRFVRNTFLSGPQPVPNIRIKYRDSYDSEWSEQMTTTRGTVTVAMTYSVQKWRNGVHLTLSRGGRQWVFDMSTINHGNDESITILAE